MPHGNARLAGASLQIVLKGRKGTASGMVGGLMLCSHNITIQPQLICCRSNSKQTLPPGASARLPTLFICVGCRQCAEGCAELRLAGHGKHDLFHSVQGTGAVRRRQRGRGEVDAAGAAHGGAACTPGLCSGDMPDSAGCLQQCQCTSWQALSAACTGTTRDARLIFWRD